MKKGYYSQIVLFISIILMSACNKDKNLLPPVSDSQDSTSSNSSSLSKLFDSISVIVWVDQAANFSRMGTAQKMDTIFSKLSGMGAKAVVMDVKGITGMVSFQSSIALPLKTWNGYTQAADFDYLQSAINEAHKYNLKVFASLSVFAEGWNYNGLRTGKVYTDSAISAVQSQVITATGEVKKITDVYSYGMLNPVQPFAQRYERSLIKEIVSNYAIDGLVLDYCRYYDITVDFSQYSLTQFGKWAGITNVSQNDIVSSWKVSDGALVPDVQGYLFNSWLEFRAQSIYNFIDSVRNDVKMQKPDMALAAYVGAWYDTYYEVGVNWASKNYDPYNDGYNWATSTYKNTGYAELLDMCMTGNYTPALNGTGWWTVQGEITGTKKILGNANAYYGSVDLGNTVWADINNMSNAVSMILSQTKGIMLFDLVHIDDPSENQFGKQLYNTLKNVITSTEAAKQ